MAPAPAWPQGQLVTRALLLADPVGAVGQRHVDDPQPLHGSGPPEIFAGKQAAFFF